MSWVGERIYAGGGDHIPDDWRRFAESTGITAILHLSPVASELFQGPLPASFLWINLADEKQAGVEERWLAGSFISHCLAQGQRVLLHSVLGRHRTRWAFVAYLMRSGAPMADALRSAAQRPWLAPYYTDHAAWTAFAEHVRAQEDRLGEALHSSLA